MACFGRVMAEEVCDRSALYVIPLEPTRSAHYTCYMSSYTQDYTNCLVQALNAIPFYQSQTIFLLLVL